jgi:transcriptional regulator with XRE-family HTH domain
MPPLELTRVTRDSASLADLRARVGLSRTEMSELLGVHRTMWARIEMGERSLRPELCRRWPAPSRVSEDEVGGHLSAAGADERAHTPSRQS